MHTHIHIVIYLTCDLLDKNENNVVSTINAPYIVWFVALQKSSAKHQVRVEFSQKTFVDLDFGHHRCPFFKIFLTLVQIRIEKITKLFIDIICKK